MGLGGWVVDVQRWLKVLYNRIIKDNQQKNKISFNVKIVTNKKKKRFNVKINTANSRCANYCDCEIWFNINDNQCGLVMMGYGYVCLMNIAENWEIKL